MKNIRYLIIFLILSLFGAACAARQAEAPMSEPGFAPEPVVMFDEAAKSIRHFAYFISSHSRIINNKS